MNRLAELLRELKNHVGETYNTLDKGSTGKNIRHDANALAKTLKSSFPMLEKDPQYVSAEDLINSGFGVMPLSVTNKLYRGLSQPYDPAIKKNVEWYSSTPDLAEIYGKHQIQKELPSNLNSIDLGFRDYMTEVKKDDVLGRVKDAVLEQFRNKKINENKARELVKNVDSLKGGNDFKRAHEWINNPEITQILRDSGFDAISHIEKNNQTYGLLNQLPTTEFSKAHALAQKNAALPIEQGGLGLHPDNTAMERARALGFDVDSPVYHGTGADITEFNTGGTGKTHGSGTFFTDNPDLAATYAPGVNSGNIIQALIRKDSPAVIEAGGASWSNLGPNVKLSAPKITKASNNLDDELLAELTGKLVDSKPVTKKAVSGTLKKIFPREFRYGDERFSTDDLSRWANEQGYSAAVFNNVKDRGPIGMFHNDAAAQPSQISAVFDPKNIRSRFAAFDPMQKNSANILASLLLGIGLAKDEK